MTMINGVYVATGTLLALWPVLAMGVFAEPETPNTAGKGKLIGEIHFPEGQRTPMAGAYVSYLRFEGDVPPDDDTLRTEGIVVSAGCFCDSDINHYEIPNLVPGTYRIGVSRDLHERVLAVVNAKIDAGDVHVRHAPPPVRRDEFVEVRILGPDGLVVADAIVGQSVFLPEPELVPTQKPRCRSHISEVPTAHGIVRAPQDGVHQVLLREFRLHPRLPIENKVMAYSPRFGILTHHISGRPRTLTLRFPRPANVSLQLTRSATSPPERHLYMIMDSIADVEDRTLGGDPLKQPLGGAHRMDLPPRLPGVYLLRVFTAREADDAVPLLTRRLVLGPGHQDLEIIEPEYHDVVVRVPDLPAGTEVRLVPQRMALPFLHGLASPLDDTGKAIFRGVPVGPYLLAVGRELMNYTVTEKNNEELHFAAQNLCALRVVVEDAQGAMARSGLRTGDLIVGIDHRYFKQWVDVDGANAYRNDGDLLNLIVRNEAGERQVRLASEAYRILNFSTFDIGGYAYPVEP